MNYVVNKESKRLEELESKIREGVQVVGESLIAIQAERLYRLKYETFEEYCKKEWGFSKSYCYQMIENHRVSERLSDISDKNLPGTHLAALAKIPAKKQAQVAAEVIEKCESENRQPTVKDFKQAAAQFVESTQVDQPVDEDVPNDVEPVDKPEWMSNKAAVDGLRRQVNELTKAIKDAPELPGFEMVNDLSNRIRVDLLNIKSAIVGCIPFNTCPYCQGNDSDCDGCKGRGWVNKHGFENAPKELQDEITSLSSGSRK